MRSSKLLPANVRSEPAPHVVQSCGKPFLLSSENHPQNVPLPIQKIHYGTYGTTVLVLRMAHRIWRETKHEPGTAGPGNMLGCCLISFHFL